jgi:U3 small nucleolar RNA-associated protein 6
MEPPLSSLPCQQGDLPLWLQYFDFCESHISDRRLSRALAKCLQFHSTVPAIWVRAAKFEFEANSSVKAARIMLQRGLR